MGPVAAGPGRVTTIIVNTRKYGTLEDKGLISIVCPGIAVLLWICFFFSAKPPLSVYEVLKTPG